MNFGQQPLLLLLSPTSDKIWMFFCSVIVALLFLLLSLSCFVVVSVLIVQDAQVRLHGRSLGFVVNTLSESFQLVPH